MNLRTMGRFTAVALLVLAMTGCSLLTGPKEATPRRYWILTGNDANPASGLATPLPEASIGVGPFRFPSYLENPNLVRRTEPNEIAFWARNRWAEPLREGFLRILGKNLANDVGTNRVVLFPWYEVELAYQVQGEVLRFEVNDSGQVILQCGWALSRPSDQKVLAVRSFDKSLAADRTDPEEVAQKMSELLEELAEDITQTIREAVNEAAS